MFQSYSSSKIRYVFFFESLIKAFVIVEVELEHQFNAPLNNPEPSQTSHTHPPSPFQQQTEENQSQSQPHTSPNQPDPLHTINPSSNTITQSDHDHATLNSAILSLSIGNNPIPPTPFNPPNPSSKQT